MNDQVTISDFFFIPLDENTFSRTLDELVPKLSALIAPHAQVFKRNLASVVSVVSVPFYMAVASVQGRRFALLYAAERIRARNHMDADGNVPEWAEKEAYTIASAKMTEEPTTKEGKEGANKVADLVLEELATARENDGFSMAANELLRQGAILVWGALEVLAVDLFVTLLNNRSCPCNGAW
jgi:hypothetical protein